MSTRATYTFIQKDETEINLYVQYDNCPKGAADYFRNMHDSSGPITFINAFLQNSDAEIMSTYSDTGLDYKYIIDSEGNVKAMDRHSHLDKDGHLLGFYWVVFFEGSYIDFINKFSNNKLYSLKNAGFVDRHEIVNLMTSKLNSLFDAIGEEVNVDEAVSKIVSLYDFL